MEHDALRADMTTPSGILQQSVRLVDWLFYSLGVAKRLCYSLRIAKPLLG